MQNDDLGFHKDGIIVIRAEGRQAKVLFEKLKQCAFVENLSLHRAPPAVYSYTQMEVLSRHLGAPIETWATVEPGDENFIPLFGIELIAGHNFIQPDSKHFIINETCAKVFGFSTPEEAIGSFLEMDGGWARTAGIQEDRDKEFKAPIVGVVKDFHIWPKHQSISPYILCNSETSPRAVSVKLSTHIKKDLPDMITELKAIWNEVSLDTAMEYYLFEDSVAALYTKEKQTVRLMNVAMITSLFISCMGLFGLALFTSKQRTKEIGIRKVLGGSHTNILMMLLNDSIKLVCIALLIASPVATFFMIRWLQGFAYRISLQVWMFALTALIIIVLTLLTVGWQSLRATLANPLASIKVE